MTEEKRERDIRSGYEYLIGGLMAVLLCILSFIVFRTTSYIVNGAKVPDMSVVPSMSSDEAFVIEVDIMETSGSDAGEETAATDESEEATAYTLSIHDDIKIFTTTSAGDNYYAAKNEAVNLYKEPVIVDGIRPSIKEGEAFEVIGFSRDGWAAVSYVGEMFFVKSSDIVKAEAPEDAMDKHMEPENSQKIRFFTPNTGGIEYVVSANTRAFSLPDVMSSGNKVDLKAGERAVVVAQSGEWYKIIYMNAEYYMLSYLEPRETYLEKHPDEEIIDNTGYSTAGTVQITDQILMGSKESDLEP